MGTPRNLEGQRPLEMSRGRKPGMWFRYLDKIQSTEVLSKDREVGRVTE